MTPILAFAIPGGTELLLILFVVILLFGAKKLPELAKGIGRSMGEFKKAREDFDGDVKAGLDQGGAPPAPESEPEPSPRKSESGKSDSTGE